LADEASADDKEWNPNDDPDFDRDNSQLENKLPSDRASNPIFNNHSVGGAQATTIRNSLPDDEER